jgi:hypothetical protein
MPYVFNQKLVRNFFSAAADGKIYWWDTKRLNEPIDKLIFDLEKKERSKYATGITKLEYDSSIVRHKIIFIFSYSYDFLPETETGRGIGAGNRGGVKRG